MGAGTALNKGIIDPAMVMTQVVEPDSELFERNRILPPGAGGSFGGAYKMLRTQVVKRLDQLGVNTLAILSPAANAGKTLTAINLSIAIAAERGRNVLLIDFDFRNPSIAKRLGFEPQLGIDDCLQGNGKLLDAMVRLSGYNRLTILPTRAAVSNSSELLADQKTADLVAEMRNRYVNRFLIFDLPPVLEVDDALAFAKVVQSGLVVVREGHSRRDDVLRSIELLKDLPIVGTVLNESRENTRNYY